MIRKSANRFSENIMLKQKITLESDSTQLNQTLASSMCGHLGFLSRSFALAALMTLGGGLVAPTLATALPRIASMNVCTDQLLMPLADPEQILGLSRFSRDGWQSFAADAARRYPILSGGAEDILVLRPDIVVASLFDKRSTRELLKQKGIHLAEFSVPRNLDEVKAQIREMGEITGHADRATAEIARLDAAIARAHKTVADKHYSVLPLSRRGWVSGSDSLVSSLLKETGLFNAAGNLGVGMGGYASLEAIVSLKPDFILVSEAGDRAEDDGRAFLLHPALERFYPPKKRIVIPERLTVCGGVTLAEALDVLVAELNRVEREKMPR
jgi:iron complex transport system substrate-binding protein